MSMISLSIRLQPSFRQPPIGKPQIRLNDWLAGNKPAGNSQSSNRASRAGVVTFCKSRKAVFTVPAIYSGYCPRLRRHQLGFSDDEPLVAQKFTLFIVGNQD